jgi:biotin carboxyl carrier protein
MIDVISDVAGTVWKITAKPGDAVAEGADVVILESMKMEVPIGAPAAGTIGEILVAEGDTVGEGDVIARLTSGT